jgi:hypothetical protein
VTRCRIYRLGICIAASLVRSDLVPHVKAYIYIYMVHKTRGVARSYTLRDLWRIPEGQQVHSDSVPHT